MDPTAKGSVQGSVQVLGSYSLEPKKKSRSSEPQKQLVWRKHLTLCITRERQKVYTSGGLYKTRDPDVLAESYKWSFSYISSLVK